MFRIGFGYDIHPLVAGRKLILGGVEIPFDKGLMGHSDADVLCHAVSDALLGAVALGDIGQHFPDTDPKYKGADSLKLMVHVRDLICEAGFRIGNVDVTIIAEAPKLMPFREVMIRNIAQALTVDTNQVSVKATTNEDLGPLGRGEGIAAHAVAAVFEI